ncbi:MAG: hypothetical protein CSA15_00020 [Candidatus Delongbacteria bacterium]|nr:MAG: hypothetical protein CSA15_00020 [Candidatus Delongbacteria bacterium]
MKKHLEYKDEKSTMLEEHLSQEEKALLNNIKFKKLNKSECKFWHLEMQKLLREKVYFDSYRTGSIEAKNWAKVFETIALWDSPNMEKEVIRNKDNYIEKINYSINSNVVLSLSANSSHHIVTFFEKENKLTNYGIYYFGRKGKVEVGVKNLLEYFPKFCLENAEKIAGRLDKHLKNEKIAQVADKNIPLIVNDLMKKIDADYDLEETEKSILLRIRTDEYRFVELSLPHKSFLKRVDKIIPTVEHIKQNIYGDTTKNTLDFALDSKSKYLNWGEVQEGFLDDFNKSVTHNRFWKKHCQTYCDKTLLDGEKLEKNTFIDSRKIYTWNIPGLQTKIIESESEGRMIFYVEYYIDDVLLFEINDYKITFYFFDGCHFNFWDKGQPKEQEWYRFLEGFAQFYKELQPDLKTYLKQEEEEHKIATLARKNIPIVAQTLFDKNQEYATYLFGETGGFYVKMKSARGRVCRVQLEYKNYKENIDKIIPTIELAEKILKESPLPFKLLNTDWDFLNIKWKKAK